MSNKMLKAALAYTEAGFSVIPIDPATKRPVIQSWKEFQDRIATSEEINKWFENHPNGGIAIACGPISNLCVADADYYNFSHLHDRQSLRDYIALHLDFPLDTVPTSQTPRGGEQYFFSCPDPPLLSRKVDVNDKYLKNLDIKCQGGYVVVPPTVRPDGTAYSWKTPLFDSEGKRVSISAQKLYERLRMFEKSFSSEKPEEIGEDGVPDPNMFQGGNRDIALFHVANLLVRAGAKRGEIHRIIHSLGKICNPPADSLGADFVDVEAKVNSAFNRQDRKDVSVAQQVREYSEQTEGFFKLESLYRELNLVSATDKSTARKALSRMHKGGELETFGKADGQYRRKQQDQIPQELLDQPGLEFEIFLPLDVQNLIRIYPGNVILLHGQKDAGKSSHALHTAYLNMFKRQVIYLNIESDSTELRSRLIKQSGESNFQQWKNPNQFISYEVIEDFDRYIDKTSGRIYLVDYLDCSDDYTMATHYMNKIHATLRGIDSIAIVYAQTNVGKGLPYGGQGLLNRPRLVLSIAWADMVEGGGGVMTIQAAKTPRHPELGHPRGQQRYYKIIGGGPYVPYDKFPNWFEPEGDKKKKV